MPIHAAEIQPLIAIMDGQYQRIHALEAEHEVFGREGDYRPRIDYYHDAVKALSAGEDNPHSKFDRLAPERIAHDVAILRQIQAKPLMAGRGEQHFSPHAEVMSMDGTPQRRSRPDAAVRRELAEAYKDYTVLFVALLAEKVEDNTALRTQDAETLEEECTEMQEKLEQFIRGEVDEAAILSAAEMLENDDLHALITAMMRSGKTSSPELRALINKLREMTGQLRDDRAAVQDASHHFATSQLAVYEGAKDTVQRLAAQGLNIAGKFVENAISRSQGVGQGRGV